MRQEVATPGGGVITKNLHRPVLRADALVKAPKIVMRSRYLLVISNLLHDRIAVLFEVCEHLGVVVLELRRREADDLIAALRHADGEWTGRASVGGLLETLKPSWQNAARKNRQ